MEKIAEFEVKDSLIIADPCYEREKKLEVKLRARKGTWGVYIERNSSSGVDFINAHHINYIGGLNKEIAGASVDSGQLGIWDKDFWKSNNNGDVNSWYGAICMTME